MAGERKVKSETGDDVTLVNVEICVDHVEFILSKLENSCKDPRWAAIARTDFQKAFMSLRAAVFIKGKKL